MAKADILKILYSKTKSPLEFNWDNMIIPPMCNYLTSYDIQSLYNIASSIKYSANINKKYNAINKIMNNRGFRKFINGTNRTVYSYLEDQRFLAKIAIDRVGLSDNHNEYKNQWLLKPFVSKMFEVDNSGVIGFAERVEPITSREEFMSVAGDAFNLLNHLIGKYILEDIGTEYFMNFGLRQNFGVVLLDYPYLYELDGNKLYCNLVNRMTGQPCGGVIDYDEGFNNLVCSKCGKVYQAVNLKKDKEKHNILIKGNEAEDIKVKIIRNNQIITDYSDNIKQTKTIVRKHK